METLRLVYLPFWEDYIIAYDQYTKCVYLMDRYIFLDIDGTLNIGRSDHLDPARYGHHFDNAAVQNLRRIIVCTSAEIVISSSWRHMGMPKLHELWQKWDLPGKLVGCAPGCWDDPRTFNSRGEEIQHRLKHTKNYSPSF